MIGAERRLFTVGVDALGVAAEDGDAVIVMVNHGTAVVGAGYI